MLKNKIEGWKDSSAPLTTCVNPTDVRRKTKLKQALFMYMAVSSKGGTQKISTGHG